MSDTPSSETSSTVPDATSGSATSAKTSLALAPETLAAHVRPGPRYTSYPPATRFTDEFGSDQAIAELERLRESEPDAPVSLYCHVPFCSRLCWYCGCNVVISRKKERGTEYVDLLLREIDMLAEHVGTRPLAEIAFGGGSPNFLAPPDLKRLVAAIERNFPRASDATFGIELDPRETPMETVAALAEFGFRRLSVGIQDFSEEVQRRINRYQSEEQTRQIVEQARAHDFTSINADLVYGLPGQTPATFADTLDAVLTMEPDQIALFGYAHLPSRLKHQKLVERDGPVPGLDERALLLEVALTRFDAAGYTKIGLDHFARADAPLAAAARDGRLHRNFQGYVVKKADYLLACGTTGITDSGHAYWQNQHIAEWTESVRAGRLPVMRGVPLADDDRVRRYVINRLMCDGVLEMNAVEKTFGDALPTTFEKYFARELVQLQSGNEVELASVDSEARQIKATELGRHLIRNVCMVFDPHLDGPGGDRPRFSSTL